jgi:hypothetical protein
MSAAFIGLDLAKSVFQVHGVDVHGNPTPTVCHAPFGRHHSIAAYHSLHLCHRKQARRFMKTAFNAFVQRELYDLRDCMLGGWPSYQRGRNQVLCQAPSAVELGRAMRVRGEILWTARTRLRVRGTWVSVLHGCTRLSQAESNQFNELVCK